MTDRTCPLGQDCDLTVAYMAGALDARRKMRGILDAAREVLRISDRDHEAWHRLRAAIENAEDAK